MKKKSLWKRFKSNIRSWMWKEDTIIVKMDKWWIRFKCTASAGKPNAQGRYDTSTDATLFTDETKEAFINCQQHAGDITDVLSKSDLYEAVEPPLRSKNRSTIWKGNRGVESMLEKSHHALAHFANGGMRRLLADALGFAGWAAYNLRIQYRL
jgi:hypothetical protein